MGFVHLLESCFCCRRTKSPQKISLVKFKGNPLYNTFSKIETLVHEANSVNQKNILIKALSSAEIFDLSNTDIEENTDSCSHLLVNEGCLPSKNDQTPTLVLDLDNTLVYSTTKEPLYFDHKININYNGKHQHVWIIERPYLHYFLNEMSRKYELVLFTAGIRQYGIKVLKEIDKSRRITYFLDRRFCRSIGKTLKNQDLFSKDIRILGRRIDKTLLVDDRDYSFCFDYTNGILIPMFNGDRNDRCLLELTEYLSYCSNLDDIRTRKPFDQFRNDHVI